MDLALKLTARRPEILRHLREPNLEGMRAFVCLVEECLLELGRELDGEEEAATFLRAVVLQGSYPALGWFRRGDPEAAAGWIERTWEAHRGAKPAVAPVAEPGERELEYLAAYNVAVAELLATRLQDAQARIILRRLGAYLGLSLDHLARMFDVTGETLRLWERGLKEVPSSRLGEILLADKALDRLLTLFRPERLPQVIRRKAHLFEREQALDWILRGRFAEVAERYDAALGWQG